MLLVIGHYVKYLRYAWKTLMAPKILQPTILEKLTEFIGFQMQFQMTIKPCIVKYTS